MFAIVVNVLVVLDILVRRPILRVASHPIRLTVFLIHPDVVDVHMCWELQVVKVGNLERFRDGHVEDDTHRFGRYETLADVQLGYGPNRLSVQRPCWFPSMYHVT